MYRHPDIQKKYDEDRKISQKECVFCEVESDCVIEEYTHFRIIKNIYPYHMWDLKQVEEHLMIVPKHHTEGFDGFKEESFEEYLKITTSYSNSGYDLFTRTTKSSRKTQPHFHTHLIRTSGSIRKKLYFEEDPYRLESE